MEGSIIGYKLWFQNPDFGVNISGSPSEILKEVRSRKIPFGSLADDPVTDIKISKIRMVEPPQEFSGGPHAEAVFDLLSYLVDETDLAEAGEVIKRDEGLAKSEDGAVAVPLLAAIASSKVESARFLVSKGIGVNHRTSYDMTALHWAAALGEDEIAGVLLDAGVEKAPLNYFLLTPAELAVLNGHKGTARVIEKKSGIRTEEVSPAQVLARMKAIAEPNP